jgi:outer membrane protein OmpA-like peptidoglycan-associated protein
MHLWKRDTIVVVSSFLIAAGLAVPARAADVDTRSTVALTYREGSGTQVDLVGRGQTTGTVGKADVKRSEGRTRVKLKLEALPHPQSLGSLYTTYMLWAVAPEGRAESLAELPHSKSFDVDATTAMPTFSLIVTAEPDSAVTRPGPRLVAENAVNDETKGRLQSAKVEYETADERAIAVRGGPDFKTPLPVLGARRAVELARAAGADRYADGELKEAEIKLATAEQLWSGRDKLSKEADVAARDAMRLAEHARSLTGERAEAAGLARERRNARTAVNQAMDQAETAQDRAEQAQAQAAMERQQAEQARTQADDAMLETAKAKASVLQAQSDADRARLEAQQARQDQAALQEQLYQSLSAILETRREARGLIVNLSDVLFDFNKADLKPGAREKLAKIAGILLTYPGLQISLEGHTDAIGSDAYNQVLSRRRAESARSYLLESGIKPEIVQAMGFGESQPVASNDSAAGRQQNRRVELVVSGEIIDAATGAVGTTGGR